MSGLLPWVLCPLLGAAGVGCAGGDNVGACQAYAARINQVYQQCGLAAPIDDVNELCPPFMNDGDVDCTAHYACVSQAYTCEPEQGVVVAEAAADCAGCF